MMDDVVQERLIDSLRYVVRETILNRKRDIAVALELEPGPLYCLRDYATLSSIAKTLEEDGDLSPCVGFCLDIAHWNQTDIGKKRDQVEANAAITNRIVHAHVSGHHAKGHFGDIPLLDLGKEDDIRPWLKLLSGLGRRDVKYPAYSGYVSLEYEAAKSRRLVIESLASLMDLMGRPGS